MVRLRGTSLTPAAVPAVGAGAAAGLGTSVGFGATVGCAGAAGFGASVGLAATAAVVGVSCTTGWALVNWPGADVPGVGGAGGAPLQAANSAALVPKRPSLMNSRREVPFRTDIVRSSFAQCRSS